MEHRTYLVRRLPEGCGRLELQGEFAPELLPESWAKLQEAKIDQFPWGVLHRGYRPEAAARVGWNEAGLHVLLCAKEALIRAEETVIGGRVCEDSCLEFFLSPLDGQLKYVNCEINPNAVMHIGIGEGRPNRSVFRELPSGFDPVHSVHCGAWWAVSFTLPAGFLQEHFGCTLRSGARMRGNFSKCGDKERNPHYGIFEPYCWDWPDYHRPEMFAKFTLE